jgi:hypothetical protein
MLVIREEMDHSIRFHVGESKHVARATDGGQHFVAVGPLNQNGGALAFVRLDERGQQMSTEIIEGYDGVSWSDQGTAALTAPDGTLRVVVNRESYIGLGFTVAAYRVEP